MSNDPVVNAMRIAPHSYAADCPCAACCEFRGRPLGDALVESFLPAATAAFKAAQDVELRLTPAECQYLINLLIAQYSPLGTSILHKLEAK